MENLTKTCAALAALTLVLSGYPAVGATQSGRHLSDTECRDLAATKRNAPKTRSQHRSELSALSKAGYNPSPWHDDPNYPADLHAAQRLVDHWFQTECKPSQ
ncbi:hypothetical protein CR51_41955 [Caballeronia megalochromosomata]|jgi:Domain of unknown function (DUF4148)|nr:hypothetical protein CR51_41955 [Caballeronia megalochromosomata]